MMSRRNYATFPGLVLGALICATAFAGRLEFGSPTVDGENVTMPIILSGDNGGGVSTMNFDLKYDPNVFEPVFVGEGAAAKAADKQVQFNVRSDGDARVIVVGLNQTTMQNGEVASVIFKKVGQGSDQTNLRIVNTSFASSDAAEVPSRGDSQAVALDGSTPEQDDEEEMEEPDNDTDPTNDDAGGNDRDNDGNNQNDPTSPTQNNSGRPAPTNPAYDAAQQPQGGQQAGNANPQRNQSISTPVRVMDEDERPAGGTAASSERLSVAMDQADNARASIDVSGEEGETSATGNPAATAADPGVVEGTEPAAGAERLQVAKSDATLDGSPAQRAAANGGAAEGAEAPATESGAQQAAQATNGGGNTQLLLIVGAVVVVAIVGLILVRKRLFA